jgi:hypothetical protein
LENLAEAKYDPAKSQRAAKIFELVEVPHITVAPVIATDHQWNTIT